MNLSTAVAICTGTGLVVMAVANYRQNRRIFTWTRRTRLTDDDAKELDDVDGHLREMHQLLCRFAQKPSTAADLDPLQTLRHLVDARAGQPGVLRTELQDIVARCDAYLGSALRVPVSGAKADKTELMVAAMRQEQARTRVATAVNGARQRIRTLRRP